MSARISSIEELKARLLKSKSSFSKSEMPKRWKGIDERNVIKMSDLKYGKTGKKRQNWQNGF